MISKSVDPARAVGKDWVAGKYYDDAESDMEKQWSGVVWPIISGSDFSTILELAPGHGRNTARLLPLASRVYAVDINQTNIDFLNQRFAGAGNLVALQNDGEELDAIDNASITFVYCFDAMVHFDSDVVRSYIKEFRRKMKPGARGFVHYSAYDKNPTGNYRDHPGWRNFMNRDLFHHWLVKEGFRILRSEYLAGVLEFTDKSDNGDIITDAVTYFELPGDAPAIEKELAKSPEATIHQLRRKLQVADGANQDLQAHIEMMKGSLSWKLTAPLRWIRDSLGK